MGENTPDPATIPEEKRYVASTLYLVVCAHIFARHYYSFKIAVDGNFKAKLKNRNLLAVPLQDGWSYFVPDGPYSEHVKKFGSEPEVCVVVVIVCVILC